MYAAGRNTEIGSADRIYENRAHGDVQSPHKTESRRIFYYSWARSWSSVLGAKSHRQKFDGQFHIESMYLTRLIRPGHACLFDV